MPQMIEHIDAISRKLQCDVLYVEFDPVAPAQKAVGEQEPGDEWCGSPPLDWQKLPIRQQVIAWLVAHGIKWKPCGSMADVNVMESYRGQIYVDLPFDKSLPAFQALEAFLELPDGTARFPDATFYCCPLELAMENAAHDEPGFWERWAEGF